MATTEDNNARYRCESQNELSTAPLNAEIVLSVQCKSSLVSIYIYLGIWHRYNYCMYLRSNIMCFYLWTITDLVLFISFFKQLLEKINVKHCPSSI